MKAQITPTHASLNRRVLMLLTAALKESLQEIEWSVGRSVKPREFPWRFSASFGDRGEVYTFHSPTADDLMSGILIHAVPWIQEALMEMERAE
jgi:hypothetical protein